MTDYKHQDIKPNRRISFNENVHIFDMSKPAPKSPKTSKVITPILKQSPNMSSDEECDFLPPTYKQSQPIYKQNQPISKQSEPEYKQSHNTGTMQSKAFLDEVINELKNHQQKVNNDLVSMPIPQKQENETKSYGHRRSPSLHDFFKNQASPPQQSPIKQTNKHPEIQRNIVEDKVINSVEKYQVTIDITNCQKNEIQIRAKENVLSVDGKIIETKPDGTKVTINFSKRFNLPNNCQMEAITSNISDNQLIIVAPKFQIKTGIRNVPIVVSQEKSVEEKIKNQQEQNQRLGRKLSKLGQKYNEIDEESEKFKENQSLKPDRIFGIRHGQNMKPVEMPGFNFEQFKHDFDDDFQNGFNAYKWDSFHDELMKPNSNATITNIPIVLEENSKNGDLTNFSEIENQQRFNIKPAQRQGKFRNISRVPIQNRANFNSENLDENIIKASKLASATHSRPWFQNGLGQANDFKGVKVSSL